MIAYLNTGQPFQIDEQDAEVVSYYRWYCLNGYVKTLVGRHPRRTISLVSMLLGKAPDGLVWDHENRDKLDNRRENIRAVTFLENTRNRSINYGGVRRDNASGVNGVHWYSRGQEWRARLIFNGKKMHLGGFKTLEEAAEARRDAEKRLALNLLDTSV